VRAESISHFSSAGGGTEEKKEKVSKGIFNLKYLGPRGKSGFTTRSGGIRKRSRCDAAPAERETDGGVRHTGERKSWDIPFSGEEKKRSRSPGALSAVLGRMVGGGESD